MRNFCEALPADRLLQGNEYELETELAKEKSHRKYIDPESGATLTYASSLVVLAHFVGCLVSIRKFLEAAFSKLNSHTVMKISPTRLYMPCRLKKRNSCAKSYYRKARLSTALPGGLRRGRPLRDDRPPLRHVFSFDKATIWTRT